MMKVTRTSQLSGLVHTMELDVTLEQLNRFASGDIFIQHAFPQLTNDEREFILTGITVEEWDSTFGAFDDDDDVATDDHWPPIPSIEDALWSDDDERRTREFWTGWC